MRQFEGALKASVPGTLLRLSKRAQPLVVFVQDNTAPGRIRSLHRTSFLLRGLAQQTMRKIVVSMFMSLDGVTESPEKWSLDYWNDDIEKLKNDELFGAGALLLGRVTYEGFAESWPKRSGDAYTDRINGMPKFVVSRTLSVLEWQNSTLIKENVASELAKLKQESGGDLVVFGSMSLVNSLIQQDLIDEYRLLVYPVVLGAGKRLFDERGQTKVKLTATKSLGSDVALLTYARAGV
jgi:dihydrofolate reductase